MILRVIVLAILLQFAGARAERVNCSAFDPKEIKLITFDVFAALMDLYTSLQINLRHAAPFLSDAQNKEFMQRMVFVYGSFAGHEFSKRETGDKQPFAYVMNLAVNLTVTGMNLQKLIYPGSASWIAIEGSWDKLIPWPDTTRVLRKVHQAGYKIAPLSNGGYSTLSHATSIFQPIPMFDIFSSDWPVGAFKPDASMYAQLLTRTKFSTSQILHVAGAKIDGIGAAEFGLFSALNHATGPIPGQVQPCFLLPNITSLLAILHL